MMSRDSWKRYWPSLTQGSLPLLSACSGSTLWEAWVHTCSTAQTRCQICKKKEKKEHYTIIATNYEHASMCKMMTCWRNKDRPDWDSNQGPWIFSQLLNHPNNPAIELVTCHTPPPPLIKWSWSPSRINIWGFFLDSSWGWSQYQM